jgi:hypothetical protein
MFTNMLVLALFQGYYAQNASNTGVKTFHSDVDISPIEAVIIFPAPCYYYSGRG